MREARPHPTARRGRAIPSTPGWRARLKPDGEAGRHEPESNHGRRPFLRALHAQRPRVARQEGGASPGGAVARCTRSGRGRHPHSSASFRTRSDRAAAPQMGASGCARRANRVGRLASGWLVSRTERPDGGAAGRAGGCGRSSRAGLVQSRDTSATDCAGPVRPSRLPSPGWWVGGGLPFAAGQRGAPSTAARSPASTACATLSKTCANAARLFARFRVARPNSGGARSARSSFAVARNRSASRPRLAGSVSAVGRRPLLILDLLCQPRAERVDLGHERLARERHPEPPQPAARPAGNIARNTAMTAARRTRGAYGTRPASAAALLLRSARPAPTTLPRSPVGTQPEMERRRPARTASVRWPIGSESPATRNSARSIAARLSRPGAGPAVRERA